MSHSTPAKSRKSSNFAIELSDRGDLRAQPRRIESARLDRAAAVIGDAEILQAELLRRRGHFLERVVAVARGGVAMECAAQIFRLDQARQAFPRPRPRIRRNSRAAPAGCNRDRARDKDPLPRGPPEFSPRALFASCAAASAGAGASRYSFKVQPRCSARFRITMLCSLLPVK